MDSSGMIDFFRVLDEVRRPWVDLNELKAKFITLSAVHHPDRNPSTSVTATGDYATLNVAYNCLRDTPQRLAHLLELEMGEKPPTVQNIPGELMDWAFEAGALLRESDQFLSEKTRNTSPMVAVQHFGKGMQLTDRLSAMQSRIQQAIRPLDEQLQRLNAAWLTGLPAGTLERSAHLPLRELQEVYQRYAFLNRWSQQIQERISTLAI